MPQPTATPQAVQARAAAALAALLGENPDAPIVSWTLLPGMRTQPDLTGQAGNRNSPDGRAAVIAWATILGTETVETPKYDADDEWTDVRAEATSGGVRIEVWAMCDMAPVAVTR